MNESVLIHGQPVSVDEFIGIGDNELDEFEQALMFDQGIEQVDSGDESTSSSESESEPEIETIPSKPILTKEIQRRPKAKNKTKTKRQRTQYQPASQPGGFDWRGIPLRMFMGSVRPNYKLLDTKTKKILKTEMEGEMRNITALYPDLTFPIYPDDIDMDIMHHEYTVKHEIARGRNAAASWKQTIIGMCALLETILVSMGVEQARSFTDTQIKTMPIYETLVLELSMKHRGGAYSIFPPEMKICMMLTVNVMIYVGAQWWLGNNNKQAEIFERIVNTLYSTYNYMGGFMQQAQGANAAAQQAAGQSPIPRAPAPPPQAGVAEMMAQAATGAAPIMEGLRNMFAGGAPAGNTPQSQPQPPNTVDGMMNQFATGAAPFMEGLRNMFAGGAGNNTPVQPQAAPAPARPPPRNGTRINRRR